ncbi:hypothetical protein DFH27DRAFT_391446 [Peziza echinospora]|nr:hypothetical protein DFH27DRAFT_391446 [Peziza echinospora]
MGFQNVYLLEYTEPHPPLPLKRGQKKKRNGWNTSSVAGWQASLFLSFLDHMLTHLSPPTPQLFFFLTPLYLPPPRGSFAFLGLRKPLKIIFFSFIIFVFDFFFFWGFFFFSFKLFFLCKMFYFFFLRTHACQTRVVRPVTDVDVDAYTCV